MIAEVRERLDLLQMARRNNPGEAHVTWDDLGIIIDLLEVQIMADASQEQQDAATLAADEEARDTAYAAQQAATAQALSDLKDEVNTLTAQLPNPEQANAVHAALTVLDEKIKAGTVGEQSEEAASQAADPGAQTAPTEPTGGEAEPTT